jgi:hypothetical protein
MEAIMNKKLNNQLISEAGEHFIAYHLAMRGINPAIMPKNSKGIDILATDDGRRVISVQVKASTGRNSPRKWMVGKNKPKYADHFYYIFANIWEDLKREPECFIVPSEYVAKNTNWQNKVPVFELKSEQEIDRFLNSWSSILSHFDLQT